MQPDVPSHLESTGGAQPTPGATLDEDGVATYVREHLADYKRPRIVELVSELPRDPNGKVRKPKLREAYLARNG
jgi:acyl-CoA synthetase (AMP-forming)/AMP-acid ligase II